MSPSKEFQAWLESVSELGCIVDASYWDCWQEAQRAALSRYENGVEVEGVVSVHSGVIYSKEDAVKINTAFDGQPVTVRFMRKEGI